MVGYMPGKRGWIKRRTRKAFLTAAATLLSERNFFDVSVIDICDAAGIPRATFYNYFEDKYDLIRMAGSDLVERLAEYRPEEGADDEKILGDLVDFTLSFCKSKSDVLPLFFKVEGVLVGVMAEVLADRIEELLSVDRLSAEVLGGAIAYGAKYWTESGCVVQKGYLADHLVSLHRRSAE